MSRLPGRGSRGQKNAGLYAMAILSLFGLWSCRSVLGLEEIEVTNDPVGSAGGGAGAAGTSGSGGGAGSGGSAGSAGSAGSSGDGGSAGSAGGAGQQAVVRLDAYPNVEKVALGYNHSCAIFKNPMEAGRLLCWGSNSVGQLGVFRAQEDGNTEFAPAPQEPELPTEPLFVAAGMTDTCVVGADSNLYCSGFNPFHSGANYKFAKVDTNQGVKQVALGPTHACVITAEDKVQCIGTNGSGELGAPPSQTLATKLQPAVALPEGAKSVGLGMALSCALTQSDKVYCWGRGGSGQLGQGANNDSDSATPVEVKLPSGTVSQMAVGYAHVCVISSENVLYCWGSNSRLQAGLGGSSAVAFEPTAQSLGNLTPESISLGAGHTCVLGNGQRICFGHNGDGQATAKEVPASLVQALAQAPPADAKEIFAGGSHSCAMSTDRVLECWGSDEYGQLGDGK